MAASRVIQAYFTSDAARSKLLQASGAAQGKAGGELRLNLAGSTGQPMPDDVLRKMEAAFGASFSDVRIHQGQQAQSIGAHAFTTGSRIFFAPGQYAPHTARGQQLLGHELAHVLQQRSGRARAPAGSGMVLVNDQSLELEADRMGARAAAFRLPLQAKPSAAVPAVSSSGLPPRALQRKLVYADGTSTRNLAEAVIASGIVPLDRHGSLEADIETLKENSELLGLVDARNAQLVALLAYRLLRMPRRTTVSTSSLPPSALRRMAVLTSHLTGTPVTSTPPVPVPESSGTGSNVSSTVARRLAVIGAHLIPPPDFDLVIVGAGSAAAYYLDTLGPAYDHSRTIVIGGLNPWHAERGHSLPTISHTARQIGMPSDNLTEYRGADQLVNRKGFANRSDAAIGNAVGHRWIAAKVTFVSHPTGGIHELTLDNGRKLRCRKVVYVAGSGAFNTPRFAEKAGAYTRRDRVISLNEFVRRADSDPAFRAESIVVWGGNAGIDALVVASRLKIPVKLWIYEGGPVWLPGSLFRGPAVNNVHKQHMIRDSGEREQIDIIDNPDGGGVRFSYPASPARGEVDVDYVVYALGSENQLAYRDPLKPLLDTAGVFGDPSSPGGEQAWLGWQNEEGSLQVFGLAAENFSNPGGRRASPNDAGVKALKKWLSGDIVTVGQLGYMRSAIRAANNYIPPSIVDRVDFGHADANMLRIHLATKYPRLPESLAAEFIGMIRNVRDGLAAQLPYGFTVAQEREIHGYLARCHTALVRHNYDPDVLEKEITKLRKVVRLALGRNKLELANACQRKIDEIRLADTQRAKKCIEPLKRTLLQLAAQADEVGDANKRASGQQ